MSETPQKIKLKTEDGCERWVQDRSKTFDGSFTVINRNQAKVFPTNKAAVSWLRRNGFPVTLSGPEFPTPFKGWEIVPAPEAVPPRLFEILPSGDPYSTAWDVREYCRSFDEETCTYRGDISGMFGKVRLINYLRRTYPGCKIRVSR